MTGRRCCFCFFRCAAFTVLVFINPAKVKTPGHSRVHRPTDRPAMMASSSGRVNFNLYDDDEYHADVDDGTFLLEKIAAVGKRRHLVSSKFPALAFVRKEDDANIVLGFLSFVGSGGLEMKQKNEFSATLRFSRITTLRFLAVNFLNDHKLGIRVRQGKRQYLHRVLAGNKMYKFPGDMFDRTRLELKPTSITTDKHDEETKNFDRRAEDDLNIIVDMYLYRRRENFYCGSFYDKIKDNFTIKVIQSGSNFQIEPSMFFDAECCCCCYYCKNWKKKVAVTLATTTTTTTANDDDDDLTIDDEEEESDHRTLQGTAVKTIRPVGSFVQKKVDDAAAAEKVVKSETVCVVLEFSPPEKKKNTLDVSIKNGAKLLLRAFPVYLEFIENGFFYVTSYVWACQFCSQTVRLDSSPEYTSKSNIQAIIFEHKCSS